MQRVAILVLNWNGTRWLRGCLSAALAQPEAFVYLVDNGSTDGSLELVRREFPKVRIIGWTDNLGFGRAYNRAISMVEAPVVALLNNDTRVASDWLSALLGALERDAKISAVGGKLLHLERPQVINHAGGRLTPLGAAYDVGFGAVDGPAFDMAGPIGCATGAALLLRRDLFLKVGGFDERYFAYFDDADLCWRFWLAGYTVHYEPRARVLHAYGGSAAGGRLSTFRLQHCQTNRLQNMFKHLETRTLLAMLPLSAGYDLARIGQLLRAGRTDGVRALVRGSRRFAELLPQVMAERHRIQAERRRSDRELLRLGALASLRDAVEEWRRLGGLANSSAMDVLN